jgi:hypothetical protein
MLRFDTHHVRTYLLWKLNPHVARLWHDDSDLILVTLKSGEKVMIHLNERFADLTDVKMMLRNDKERGRHTLMMFWADMLLPRHKEHTIPQQWMQAVMALYDNRIYAFDIYAKDVVVFPVVFQPVPGYAEYYVTHGDTINFAGLYADVISVKNPFIAGEWNIGSFDPRSQDTQENILTSVSTSMRVYYEIMQLDADATPEMVRAAYRRLAREVHPDLNEAADASDKMQQLNEAYQKIMAQFG